MVARTCNVEDCEAVHYAKGKCRRHYNQTLKRVRHDRGPCEFPGCGNRRNGKTYCMAHEDHFRAGQELRPLQRRAYIIDGQKECMDCERVLPVEMFYKHGQSVIPRCKDCQAIKARRIRYGIPRDQVIEMMTRPCDACGTEELSDRQRHIDHDHDTGEVRGVLCHRCNVALGMVRSDPQVLRGLIAYMDRFAT